MKWFVCLFVCLFACLFVCLHNMVCSITVIVILCDVLFYTLPQAEGIQELQAGQREIQDRQEEVVLAQHSSEIQQRLGQIKQQEASSSQASNDRCALCVFWFFVYTVL